MLKSTLLLWGVIASPATALAAPVNVDARVPQITDTSYTDGSNHQGHRFANWDLLLRSEFWKQVVQNPDPQVAGNTVVLVDSTNSTLFFGDSETQMTPSISRWWRHRQVEMTELQLGPSADVHMLDTPISPCVSGRTTSTGGSYTHTYKWSQAGNHILTHTMSSSLSVFGLSLSAGITEAAGSVDKSASITCPVAPGRTVQVLGSFRYKVWPRARKRRLVLGLSARLHWDNWENVQGRDHPSLSHLYLSTDQGLNYYCTDRDEKLRCAANLDVQNDDPHRA